MDVFENFKGEVSYRGKGNRGKGEEKLIFLLF